jgi:hypothetical protein
VSFGADLGKEPNNTTTCGAGIPPLYLYGVGSPSCLYFSGAPGPSPYAPQSGTVTAVRIRVGAVTGPMQVVVMRSLYQNKAGDPGHPYFACCFVEHYGPVFEPQPNAVTTVPTNLPMTEEATPPPEDFTTNAAGDFLALSVLAPNVPVPMFIDNQSGDSGFYPAPTEQTVPAPSQNPVFQSTDLFAGQVLIAGELDTGGGAPAAPAGAAPTAAPAPLVAAPAQIPQLTLPVAAIPVKGNTATVPLQCLVLDCTGILALQNAPQAVPAHVARHRSKAPKAKRPKIVNYGSTSFSLKAGASGKVKVKLNSAGRVALKRHHTVKAWANLRFTAGGGAPRSVAVTLKHA